MRRQRDAPAVRQHRGLSRVPPNDRHQVYGSRAGQWTRARLGARTHLRAGARLWWDQVGLNPRSQVRGIASGVRRDDHEREQSGPWRADRSRRGATTGYWGGRGARDVGDVKREVQLGRRDRLRPLVVLPGRWIAEAPSDLGVFKAVISTRAVEIRANLYYAWHGVSVRARLARDKDQRQERRGQDPPGLFHRRLIVSDRVARTTPALCRNPNVAGRGIREERGGFRWQFAKDPTAHPKRGWRPAANRLCSSPTPAERRRGCTVRLPTSSAA